MNATGKRYPDVCHECRRFVPVDAETGECHRKAPCLGRGSLRAVWPQVTARTVACGEGSLRPDLRGEP